MFRIFGITHVGMIRDGNEDSFMINKNIYSHGEVYIESKDSFAVALADGMGGMGNGDVASKMVLQLLANFGIEQDSLSIFKTLNKIQESLINYGKTQPIYGTMGSTLVGVNYKGNKATIFNVGDSRIYIFKSKFLRQLTKDQTLVQQLFEKGDISYREKENHELSHILTQCMGGGRQLMINPEVIEDFEIISGNILLICSDGLYNKLDEDSIEEVLGTKNDLSNKGRALVNLANYRGGEDNITVILVEKY